jgi:coenzyme F420-reducing hydrogenase delta subunit
MILRQIGLDQERVRMYNMSSAMANQFVEVAKEMTEKVKKMGSNPLKK